MCEQFGLKEVADYWQQVVNMNDHQKSCFTNEEANNSPFCPSLREKFHTFVLRALRNISEAP